MERNLEGPERRAKKPQKLTRPLLDRLRRQGVPGERIFDTETKGLYVRVNQDRSLTFAIMYGDKKARRQRKLGKYLTDFVEIGEVRRAAVRMRSKVVLGADPAAEKRAGATVPFFREWRDDYLSYLQLEKCKKTWKRDRQYLELAVQLFGGKKLPDITERDCEDFYTRTRLERGDVSANRALASLRACLNRARRKKWIKESPASDIDRQKEPNPRTRVFTEAETARLLGAVANLTDPYQKAGMLLMFSTGCRLGEALNLKWEVVDLERGRVNLPNPKAGKPQALPLMPSAWNFLKVLEKRSKYVVAVLGRPYAEEEVREWKEDHPGKEPPADKPRADLKRAWRTVLEDAKKTEAEEWEEAHPEGPPPSKNFLLDAHIHDIRRTVLTRIAEQYGVGAAQLVGRHSSSSITWRHYVHAEAEAMRAPLEGVTEAALARVLAFKKEEGGATQA